MQIVGLFNDAMLGLEICEPGGNGRCRPPGHDEKKLQKADDSAVFMKKGGLSTQNPARVISRGL